MRVNPCCETEVIFHTFKKHCLLWRKCSLIWHCRISPVNKMQERFIFNTKVIDYNVDVFCLRNRVTNLATFSFSCSEFLCRSLNIHCIMKKIKISLRWSEIGCLKFFELWVDLLVDLMNLSVSDQRASYF